MKGTRCIGLAQAALALLATASVGFFAVPGSGQDSKTELKGPEKVVQEQVEAYNRRDLEGFLKCYSPGTKLYTYPDQAMGSGLESMRATYGKMFADNPKLKVKVAQRIVQREYVIDHEQVSTGSRELTAVAIYRVKEGKIIEVRFLK